MFFDEVYDVPDGRWADVGRNDRGSGIWFSDSPMNLMAEELWIDGRASDLTEGSEYDGRRTVRITVEKGRRSRTVHVAADGPPFVLAVVDDNGEVVVEGSDWDAPLDVEAPARATLMNLDDAFLE